MPHPPFQLIAPPHTPLRNDGALHLEAVEKQAAHLALAGVDGVFVAGSTGEGQFLTVRERIALTEHWAAAGERHGLRVIVHVGHNCQADAQHLAEHASSTGVSAIAAHSCYYQKPTSVEGLVEYCKPIADAAPGTPFYYYHIPALTGVEVSMARFVELAHRRLPSLAGVKFTASDLVDLQECLRVADGSVDIFFGLDEVLLAAVALGAHGAVGSTYNFLTPLFRELIRAVEDGDLPTARRKQHLAIGAIETLKRFGYLRASKHLMTRLGCPCGPARPPAAPLSGEEMARLDQAIENDPALSASLSAASPG